MEEWRAAVTQLVLNSKKFATSKKKITPTAKVKPISIVQNKLIYHIHM
jgi:hypothetical protein